MNEDEVRALRLERAELRKKRSASFVLRFGMNPDPAVLEDDERTLRRISEITRTLAGLEVERGSGYAPGTRHWVVGDMTVGHNACGAPDSSDPDKLNGTRSKDNVTCPACMEKIPQPTAAQPTVPGEFGGFDG